jgi:hypothetical protein
MCVVSKSIPFAAFIAIISAIVLSSCATPVAPTGGEPDRTGPLLITTFPNNETVNFRERVVRFTFEDYVDRGSFSRAFQMEPDINIPYEITWRRKTVTINLSRPLPDSTTVLFQITTDLRDTRGNNLKSPISLALSTGPQIDGGEVSINVKPLIPGTDTQGLAVMLYRDPVDLSRPARYAGYPDTSGTVHFRYLSPGNYMAFLLQDGNRNRTWEQSREYAQPVTAEMMFELEDTVPVHLGIVWFAKLDTISPRLETVGLLSANRMRLRFSRPIQYLPQVTLTLTDTVSRATIDAAYLFNDRLDKNVAFFHTEQPLVEGNIYRVDVTPLQGINGNDVLPYSSVFEGSSDPDTSSVRFLGDVTNMGIHSNEPMILQYSSIIHETGIADSLKLIRNREVDSVSYRSEVWNNLLFVYPVDRWIDSDSYTFSTWDPQTQRLVNVQNKLIKESDLGEISISVDDSTLASSVMRYFIYTKAGDLVARGEFQQNVKISDLAVGSFHLLVYPVQDGEAPQSGYFWNHGTVFPYRSPSPLFVNPSVPVHSRMTSEVSATFNIGVKTD